MFKLEMILDSDSSLEFTFSHIDEIIEFLLKEKYLYKWTCTDSEGFIEPKVCYDIYGNKVGK